MAGSREVTVEMTVNGRAYQRQIPARTLLVHLLRDEFRLTGTHVGCDTTQCGACTVALDGVAVKACTVLAAQASGHEITTIEGLARQPGPPADAGRDGPAGGIGGREASSAQAMPSAGGIGGREASSAQAMPSAGGIGGSSPQASTAASAGSAGPVGAAETPAAAIGLHPVQQAFWQKHGLQCGYCTPGMVMAVRQLIADNPDPTEDEVRSGLSGNICRCTGYQNIVDAVLAAAQMIRSAPAEPGSGTSPAGAPPAGAPRGVPGES